MYYALCCSAVNVIVLFCCQCDCTFAPANGGGSLDVLMVKFVALQHLNNAGQLQELDFGHHFDRVKSADDDDNARSAKQDGLEKRQKQKRESENEMRRQWFEEVYIM